MYVLSSSSMQRGSFVVVIWLLLTLRALGAGDPSLKERFLSESARGWEALKAFYEHCEVTGIETTEVREGGKRTGPPRSTVLSFKRNGKFLLRESTATSDGVAKGKAIATGANSRYSFFLKRSGKSDSWVIKDYVSEPFYPIEGETDVIYYYLVAPWLIVPGKPLTTWTQESGFTLREVVPAEENGHSYAKLHFDYKSTDANEDAKVIRGGWIICDPNRSWSIQQYEMLTNFGKVGGVLHYGEAIEGIPILRDITLTITNDKTKREQETHFEIQEFSPRDVPEDEFTLPAFGLPEVALASSSANWSRFVLFAAGGMLVLCMGILIYRHR